MICPNCGYNQQDGNVCGECQTLLKATAPPLSQGIKHGWEDAAFTKSGGEGVSQETSTLKAQIAAGFQSLEMEESENSEEPPKPSEPNKVTVRERDPVKPIFPEKPKTPQPPKASRSVPQAKAFGETKVSPVSFTQQDLQKVLMTTTESLPGGVVSSYKGLVHGDAVLKMESLDSVFSSAKEVGGIRNTRFQELLNKALAIATSELKIAAVKLGGNAIVGVHFQYEKLSGQILGVHITGTAVLIEG